MAFAQATAAAGTREQISAAFAQIFAHLKIMSEHHGPGAAAHEPRHAAQAAEVAAQAPIKLKSIPKPPLAA